MAFLQMIYGIYMKFAPKVAKLKVEFTKPNPFLSPLFSSSLLLVLYSFKKLSKGKNEQWGNASYLVQMLKLATQAFYDKARNWNQHDFRNKDAQSELSLAVHMYTI